MMLRLCLITGLVIGTLGARTPRIEAEVPLPDWRERELARSPAETETWGPGELLLLEDSIPGEPEQEVTEALDLPPPAADDSADTQVVESPIPETYWESYFGAKPDAYLVDPQGLLSPTDYRERLAFLNYHAGDSSIDLYVYVFGGDQEIPSEVRDEELMERFFAEGRPALVLFYHFGEPERASLFLSPSLADVVSTAEQRRALESSVIQAFKDTEPARQIEAFLIQMSIRIYWMERMFQGEPGGQDGISSKPPSAREDKEKGALSAHLAPIMEKVSPYVVPAGAILGLLCVVGIVVATLRIKRRYLFPDFEVEPRLGAPHAAGVGAVISFASASVPPAAQRDQVPDYLRRA